MTLSPYRRLAVESLESRTLLSVSAGATLTIAKDLNTANAGSFPYGFLASNGTAYFAAQSTSGGWERFHLWRSNGTPEGTTPVSDLTVGGDYESAMEEMLEINGTLYFTVGYQPQATNDGGFVRLYKSNGTAAGTTLLKQFDGGAEGLVNVNGTLYLHGSTGTVGEGLWKSDGTAAGTVLVKQFDGWLSELTRVGSRVYLVVNGDALWRSDGTSGTTVLIKQFASGLSGSTVRDLAVANDVLYFAADDGVAGLELWTSNGFASGTRMVKDLRAGAEGGVPRDLVGLGAALYFRASDGNCSSNTLWKSDGTAAGTAIVKDLTATTGHDYADWWDLTELNSGVYFLADRGGDGLELWRTDGTSAGTALVTAVGPATPGSTYAWDFALTKVGSSLYFRGDDGVHGQELWKSDGTATGTAMLADLRPGAEGSFPYGVADVAGTLFFRADDGLHGAEPWISNGTAAGTSLLADIHTATESAYPEDYTSLGAVSLFFATDASGPALWRTDGTAAGTSLVKEVDPTTPLDELRELTRVGSAAFFTAGDAAHGDELWISDGTAAGTRLVQDIAEGEGGSWPGSLTAVGGRLYFVADDGLHGRELWRSDGTSAGTGLVADLAPGPSGTDLQGLIDLAGTLYFTAAAATGGEVSTGLWRSDGTPAGTVLVQAFPHSEIGPLAALGGSLYFSVFDQASGSWGLWKSDGTAAGTALVRDFGVGEQQAAAWPMAELGGSVYLLAPLGPDGASGCTLWKTDGTPSGTVSLKAFPAVTISPYLVAVHGALFFPADDGVHGVELWTSDGTAAATAMLADLNPGTPSSMPREVTAFGERIYFCADRSPYLDELWVSDGTAKGTALVRTLFGLDVYHAGALTAVEGKLLFTADDLVHGAEPWVLSVTDITPRLVVADGGTTVSIQYEITGGPVDPFDVGFFRSTDATFGGGDVLTGSARIDAAEDLTTGVHTRTFHVGNGAGRIGLPGAGAEENDFDYFVLAVVDHAGAVAEASELGGEANNAVPLAGVYHASGGPVMIQGTDQADAIAILPDGVRVELNGQSYAYDAGDTTGVRARAHAGDDLFQFACGGGFSPGSTSLSFLLIGGAGANTATLAGSTSESARDTASLTPTWGSLVGPGYSLVVKNTTGIRVDGQGGPDKAYLYDSAQADTFTAYPTYAVLSSGQFANRVDNFPNVYAYATAEGAGTDTAQFYAGLGNGLDLFSGSPTYAVMTGPTGTGRTYYNRAESFDALRGDSADSESDVATLYDSALTTTATQYSFVLDAAQRTGEIHTGSAGSIRAAHFRTTVLGTRDHGPDQAQIYGSSAVDTLQAKMDANEVWLLGPDYKYRASQVQHVEAFSSIDQPDTAQFYDSAGSDAFSGGPGSGQMTTPGGLFASASGFRYVTAYSTRAGTDTADLAGLAGTKDYFVGQPTQATLGDSDGGLGKTYFDWVSGFERVTAYGQAADGDQARLSGTSAQETFTSDFYRKLDAPAQRDPSRPFASLAGTGFSNIASSFRYVTAVGGANDLAELYAASATDVFSATPLSAVMSAAGFYHEAKGFADVHAHGTPGAQARLFDAALHVLLEGRTTWSRLTNLDGTPFTIWAEAFSTVRAYGDANDQADFYGTSAVDQFSQSPGYALLSGGGQSVREDAFGTVRWHPFGTETAIVQSEP